MKVHKSIVITLLGLTYFIAYFVLVQAQSSWSVAILLVPLLIELTTTDGRSDERVLVTAALTFGCLPLFGWLPEIRLLSPLGIVFAVWVAWALNSGAFSNFRLLIPTTQLAIPLSSAVIATITWSQFWGENYKKTFALLMRGWDHSAHFNFYLQNLLTGGFIMVAKPPGDSLDWAGANYPTGIHFVWASVTRAFEGQVLENRSLALTLYSRSVLSTFVIACALVSLAILRVAANNKHRWLVKGCSVGVPLGLIVFGPFSQVLSAGFVNISVVLVAQAALVSLAVRPLQQPLLQLASVFFFVLTIAYNWFPVIVLALPSAFLASRHAIKHVDCRLRWPSAALLVLMSIVPLLQLSALGVKHLENPGGIVPFPMWLIVTLGCLGLIIVWPWPGSPIHQNSYWQILVPAIALLFSFAYFLNTDAGLTYYFYKFSTFVGSQLLLVVAINGVVLLNRTTMCCAGQSLRTTIKTLCLAVAVASSVSQIFGFVGPFYDRFPTGQAAPGLDIRAYLFPQEDIYLESYQLILDEVDEIRKLPVGKRSCLTILIPHRLRVKEEHLEHILYADHTYRDLLNNVWFHSLSNSLTTQAWDNAYSTPGVASSFYDEINLAIDISDSLNPKDVCVLSSRKTNEHLKSIDESWETRDLPE